jgi:putative endonuclease
MYCLYILRSHHTGKYYVGSTEDLARRLREHNGELPNPGTSTVAGRPWELVFHAGYPSRTKALEAERFVKKMKSKRWLTKLVEGRLRLPDF